MLVVNAKMATPVKHLNLECLEVLIFFLWLYKKLALLLQKRTAKAIIGLYRVLYVTWGQNGNAQIEGC